MKTFVDFITDLAKDNNLITETMEKLHKLDHSELSSWFKEKGYNVSEAESKQLKDNKDSIKSSTEVGVAY
jgi:hypothetical protein